MSETLISTRKCNFSAIKIPSIDAALSVMSSEILNASLLLPKIQEAAISLEEIIRNSHFVDVSARHEATALKDSALRLEFAIFEIQERMSSLEEALRSNAIIPAILSTADDISTAIRIAVCSPGIDWPFAEVVLQRFSFLWTEEQATLTNNTIKPFRNAVWHSHNFLGDITEILRGGDCWRVRKSLEMIQNIVRDAPLNGYSADIFDSLASIILQPPISLLEDAQMKWIYLIARNQKKTIGNDIPRLINSFLYSRKGETAIVVSILDIIHSIIHEEIFSVENCDVLSDALKIPGALVMILVKEKRNPGVISVCLNVTNTLLNSIYLHMQRHSVCRNFEECGICEALMAIAEIYILDKMMVQDVLGIISYIISYGDVDDNDVDNENDDGIERFITAGLLKILVQVSESPYYFAKFDDIIQRLCGYDEDIILQLIELGMPEDFL
jgi:hypothetical protein